MRYYIVFDKIFVRAQNYTNVLRCILDFRKQKENLLKLGQLNTINVSNMHLAKDYNAFYAVRNRCNIKDDKFD